MKTATVRDLRYSFPRIESWLENGEQIEITKHGRTIGRLVPTGGKNKKPLKPDFMEQLKEVWGDRVLSRKEVEAMQAAELEDEEG